jgi:hypothetical protein
MATRTDDSFDALLTGHAGAARPSYAVANTTWVKSVSSALAELYFYDGVSDILLGSLDLTLHTFSPNMVATAKAVNEAKTADVASAATCNIWGTTGNLTHITGTTGITSFGTAPQAGARRALIFDGAVTITHHATTLKLPGGKNLVTSAGDVLVVVADTTANMVVEQYVRAGVGFAQGTVSKNIADATATVSYTTPFRPSKISFTALGYFGSTSQSHGSIIGTAQQCTWHIGTAGGGVSAAAVLHIRQSSGLDQTVTCTITDTGFDLTYTKTGSPAGTAYIQWQAEI